MKTVNHFVLAIVLCMTSACRWAEFTSIDAYLFDKNLEQTPNPQLIDVRTLQEYTEGHLPGAILMDIKDTTFGTLIQKLDKTRPVFVYCRSGKRSLDAAKILNKNKFKTVYNLDGGIIAWKEKSKTIEQ